MAEDIHNPLNNPGAEPESPAATPPASEPEIDTELSEFLDDVFESSQDVALPEEPEAGHTQEGAEDPSPLPAEAPVAETSAPEEETPDASPGTPESDPSDDLQRQVLERLNTQLERMSETPEEPAPQAEPVTPQAFLDHYRPKIDEYVRQGWIEEDRAALYPMDVAMQIHLFEVGGQLQQGVQQTQQFTEAEQTRQAHESAQQQLNSAMDEVASRGEVFNSLSDPKIRNDFQTFLVEEVNPRVSQINSDFLAKQFYAFSHQTIFNLQQQNSQAGDTTVATPAGQGEPSPAQLAQQEGASTRAAPSDSSPPEFVELLEGTPAASWYQ